MGIHRSRLVADDDHLQAALRFELGGQSKHLWIGLRLSKHEVAKLVARKGTLFKEHHPIQVFFERHLTLLVSLEDKAVTPVHLGPIELEVFSGALARQVVPSFVSNTPPTSTNSVVMGFGFCIFPGQRNATL